MEGLGSPNGGGISEIAFNKVIDEWLTGMKKELTELTNIDDDLKKRLLEKLNKLIQIFHALSTSEEEAVRRRPQAIFLEAISKELPRKSIQYKVETEFKDDKSGEVTTVAKWYKKANPKVPFPGNEKKGRVMSGQKVIDTRVATETGSVLVKDLICEKSDSLWRIYAKETPLLQHLPLDRVWDALSPQTRNGMWEVLQSLTMFSCALSLIPPEAMGMVEEMAGKLIKQDGVASNLEQGVKSKELAPIMRMLDKMNRHRMQPLYVKKSN